MAAIYTANHLEKKYGGRAALRDVSFSIEPGKLVGLLGPNGAGKSTLIKCSMGLLTPTSGEIAIGGVKPGPASKSITSYLPDRMALSSGLRVRDAVAMYADFFTDFDRTKARDMLLDLKLDDGQRIGAMSKGMREKMQLCLVMARAARLYLLDEPLGGVRSGCAGLHFEHHSAQLQRKRVRRALHPSDRGYRARAGRGADAQR